MALLVAATLFMEILDATIIAPAIPLIAASFGVEAVDVNVAMSAYLVTVAVLIPATGWLLRAPIPRQPDRATRPHCANRIKRGLLGRVTRTP